MAATNPLRVSATPIVANNAYGIGPRNIIRQAIKAAGAIQDDIGSEVM